MDRNPSSSKSRCGTAVSLLALLSVLALTGCVKLGLRVDLAKVPVTSIEATMPKGPAIAPGERSPLVVSFTDSTGKVWVTEGAGKGKVRWKDLTVTPTVVSFKKGTLRLPHDPRLSDGKLGHVTINVPSHPTLTTSLDIPLRYDYPFVAAFTGSAGTNGLDGTNGIDGTSGTMGSLDPNNPSAGGNGSDGTNGSDGSDGGAGGDGPPVQVQVTLRPGPHPLLQASVSVPGHRERFYLIDPNGGSLTIKSEGGPGGSGGKGGRGGQGGSGGIGTPNGSNGSNGLDGHDGIAGSSGDGGLITVTYDPQVQPYLAAIHTSSPGGPVPVFHEQAVAPLW